MLLGLEKFGLECPVEVVPRSRPIASGQVVAIQTGFFTGFLCFERASGWPESWVFPPRVNGCDNRDFLSCVIAVGYLKTDGLSL